MLTEHTRAQAYADGDVKTVRLIEAALDADRECLGEDLAAKLEDIEVYRIYSACRQEEMECILEKLGDLLKPEHLKDLAQLAKEMLEMQTSVNTQIEELTNYMRYL